MQTFLPYPNFAKSAACLDYRRLGKQRLEAYDIFGILTDFKDTDHTDKQKAYLAKRYPNHPAVLMWDGYEGGLVLYGWKIALEWASRGYNDTYESKFYSLLEGMDTTLPPWHRNEQFHSRHRSMLLGKDPEHYGRMCWSEEPDLGYLWPTKEGWM